MSNCDTHTKLYNTVRLSDTPKDHVDELCRNVDVDTYSVSSTEMCENTFVNDDKRVNTNVSEFRICFLNVCGLKSKMIVPEFLTFITQYTMLCFVETKLDKFDSIDITRYELF